MSPNPKCNRGGRQFHLPLTSVMMAGLSPLFWLNTDVFLSKTFKKQRFARFIPRGCRSRNTESTLIFDRTSGAFGLPSSYWHFVR